MLERIEHADTLEIRLARPPVNALSPALVQALGEALRKAPGEGARAVVLSAHPGLFSAGLDVPALLALDRVAMTAFWRDFFALLEAIACAPIPVVAAITGHSPAGGTVLALYADYRVMAAGPYKLGLNETQVGLRLPGPILGALRRLLGPHAAERHIIAGNLIDGESALRIGLVDELAPAEQVVERALAWCGFHLGLPQYAMLGNRNAARADLHALFADPATLRVEEFIEGWFHPESQAVLHELVARLKQKR